MRSVRAFLIGGAVALAFASVSIAQEIEPQPAQKWSFDGPLGTFDRAAAQRGFQVYREVCAACHALNLVQYHSLTALGYSDAEVKAIAASVQVPDEPNDIGEIVDRAGRPSDYFKAPFANEKAARASMNGALPPDLSLIVKGRKFGPDYLYALLVDDTTTPPADVKMGKGMYFDTAFPGHQIAMPPPLTDDRVQYADGTKATLQQEAHDVVTFLAWTADPHLEDRHRIGARVLIVLLTLSGVMYGVKRKVWSDQH